MKLLMTCDAVGGVWQYANDLARGLAGQGVEVILAVLGPSPLLFRGEERDAPTARRRGEEDAASQQPTVSSPFRRASAAPFPSSEEAGSVTLLPTSLPLDWLAATPAEVLHTAHTLATLATEHRVDLIHLNSPALAVAGPFPAPVIAVAHGCVGTWFAAADGTPPPAELAWHGELMRAGLLAADAVVAPSASYATTVQRHYDLPTAPIIIHNGRTPFDRPSAAPADHVFTAGRLWDRVKNTALLDEIAALLPVPFRAAGPTTAPHGETVTARHLDLLGTLDADALATEYASAPVFVSAARFEPFGLAVLEAAQAGCPLILSGIDTFRELWSGAAQFAGDDDPAAWAAAIERVRTEPGLRAHLGEAARVRAARYTVEAMTSAMLDLYRGLLAEPERVAA